MVRHGQDDAQTALWMIRQLDIAAVGTGDVAECHSCSIA